MVDCEIIVDFFCVIYNIKGDVLFCKFDLGVVIVYLIEMMMGCFWEGEIFFFDLFVEMILFVIDCFELVIDVVFFGKLVENLCFFDLV